MTRKDKFKSFHELTPQVLGFIIKLDALPSAASNTPILDIFHFEDELRKKFPEWDEDQMSMEDLIRDKYGEQVLTNVKNII